MPCSVLVALETGLPVPAVRHGSPERGSFAYSALSQTLPERDALCWQKEREAAPRKGDGLWDHH